MVHKSHKSSIDSITAASQTSSGIILNTVGASWNGLQWPSTTCRSNFIHVVCFAFIYGSRLELDIYQTKQQRIVIMCHSSFALNFKDCFSSKAELCRCVLCLEVTVSWEGRSTCSTISNKLFKKTNKTQFICPQIFSHLGKRYIFYL